MRGTKAKSPKSRRFIGIWLESHKTLERVRPWLFRKKFLSYAWHALRLTDVIADEPVPDLPGEDGRRLELVLAHAVHHRERRHARLGAADRLRPDGAGLVVARGINSG